MNILTNISNFPVHPNTKNKIDEHDIRTGNIILIEPISYLEMQGLLERSALVLTDSGGLQKEAYFMDVLYYFKK